MCVCVCVRVLVRVRVGEWAENCRNGYGVYTYVNGDMYEGEWSNNLRHGQGTYTYADSGVKVIQWNLSVVDTTGPKERKKVSSLERCSYFRG